MGINHTRNNQTIAVLDHGCVVRDFALYLFGRTTVGNMPVLNDYHAIAEIFHRGLAFQVGVSKAVQNLATVDRYGHKTIRICELAQV
jgi:hypothetical protein